MFVSSYATAGRPILRFSDLVWCYGVCRGVVVHIGLHVVQGSRRWNF